MDTLDSLVGRVTVGSRSWWPVWVREGLEQGTGTLGRGAFTGGNQVGQGVRHASQVGDPRLKVGSSGLGQRPSRVAALWAARVEVKQFLDLVEGEPEFLCPLDELQQLYGHAGVVAVAAGSPRWRLQEATTLVVAQRLGIHLRSLGQLAGSHDPSMNPGPGYEVNPVLNQVGDFSAEIASEATEHG